MRTAHSIDSILEDLNKSLGVKTRVRKTYVPSDRIGVMIAGQPAARSFETRTVTETTELWSKLIGILFCSPTSRLGKEEIIPQLEYFHYRSAHFVDFYCVGYESFPPPENDDLAVVASIDEVDWAFSSKDYNSCRAQLEACSVWKYSGESELLLMVVRKERGARATLDFSTAIACNLEKMQKDEAFSSVRAFFEQIFRFGETYRGSDPVWELSDKMGLEKGKNFLQEAILSLIPEATRRLYSSARHYAIQDISK